MDEKKFLAGKFETNRAHLRAVAYRMLGSPSEVDDAVQEAWLRLSRSDTRGVENLAGWLTTVVARICLDMLRSRKSRREEPIGPHVPEPAADDEYERDSDMADSVGAALLVVLETLAPAERLAFVLHDMFAVPVRGDRADRRPHAGSGSPTRQPRPPPGAGHAGPCRTPISPPAQDRRRVSRGLARRRFRGAARGARSRRRVPRRQPRSGWARWRKSAARPRSRKPSRAARRPPSPRWSMARWRWRSSSAGNSVSCCA